MIKLSIVIIFLSLFFGCSVTLQTEKAVYVPGEAYAPPHIDAPELEDAGATSEQ